MTLRGNSCERNENESRQIHINQRDLEELREGLKACQKKNESLEDRITQLQVCEAEKRGRDRIIGILSIALLGLTQGFILLKLGSSNHAYKKKNEPISNAQVVDDDFPAYDRETKKLCPDIVTDIEVDEEKG